MKFMRCFPALFALWLSLQLGLPATVGAAPFAYIAQVGFGTLLVLDTATDLVTAIVSVGLYPIGVAVAPDGKRVFVTNRDSNTLSVIAAATNEVVATVPVDTPFGVAVAPNGRSVHVVNVASNTLSVIDANTATVTKTVAVGSSPRAVAVKPDGTRVYVTNWNDSTVSVIDSTACSAIATVPVGSWPTGVAVSPDGTDAYVTN